MRLANRGFTLLELLVVVLIIGLITSFAVLSVGGRQNVLEQESRRLAALIRLASEEAILNSADLALQLRRQGYRFAVLTPTGQIAPLEDDEGSLRDRTLPEGLRLQATINGEEVSLTDEADEQAQASVFLFSSGEITPFLLELQTDEGVSYRLRGDFSGHVEELGRDNAG